MSAHKPKPAAAAAVQPPARPGSEFEFAIDDLGFVSLTAVPVTSLELRVVPGARDGTAYAVKLKGAARGLPNKTPCTVTYAAVTEREPTLTQTGVVPGDPVLTVRGDEGEIALRFDLVAAQVFEPSKVSFGVEPKFLLAGEWTVAGTLDLDHTLGVAPLAKNDALVGDVVTFTPVSDPLFDGCTMRLVIEELDEGADEHEDKRDLHRELDWAPGARDPRGWRVGCTAATGAPVLAYPEASEVGGYEFGMKLQASVDGKPFVDAPRRLPVLQVPRPTLEEFALVTHPPNLFQVLRTGARTARDVALISQASVQVKVRLGNVGPHLRLPLEVDLWSYAALPATDPVQPPAYSVGPLLPAPLVVETDERGECHGTLCALGAFVDNPRLRDFATSFAVLRILPSSTQKGGYLPVQQVLSFHDTRHVPIDEDVLRGVRPHGALPVLLATAPASLAEGATAVASTDLPAGIAPTVTPIASRIRFGGRGDKLLITCEVTGDGRGVHDGKVTINVRPAESEAFDLDATPRDGSPLLFDALLPMTDKRILGTMIRATAAVEEGDAVAHADLNCVPRLEALHVEEHRADGDDAVASISIDCVARYFPGGPTATQGLKVQVFAYDDDDKTPVPVRDAHIVPANASKNRALCDEDGRFSAQITDPKDIARLRRGRYRVEVSFEHSDDKLKAAERQKLFGFVIAPVAQDLDGAPRAEPE